jgi:hypothetical protein
MKRRSPLDPESSRTLIVLFLTFSPVVTLGSGVLVQSVHVYLLFSFELVRLSSNFFDLGANFFDIRPLLVFGERLLNLRVISSGKSALFAFWREGFSFPQLALCNLHLFSLKMLITVTTAVTLPVFAVSIAVSSALVVSLGAVLATLIGWGSVDEYILPKGLSNLRCLSTLNSCVAVPSFLFTVGTVTGVVVTFLTFLRLNGFLLAFHMSLKHGLHEGHALIAPRLLVGLLELRGLTCCCLEGLTIAVIATAVQGVVGLVGTAVGFAMLTELLAATLLRDLTSQAPRCLVLWVTLGFGWGCTALTLCLEFLALLLNHDLLDGFKVQ